MTNLTINKHETKKQSIKSRVDAGGAESLPRTAQWHVSRGGKASPAHVTDTWTLIRHIWLS